MLRCAHPGPASPGALNLQAVAVLILSCTTLSKRKQGEGAVFPYSSSKVGKNYSTHAAGCNYCMGEADSGEREREGK